MKASSTKTLEDFTPEEIGKFEVMQKVMSAYNSNLMREQSPLVPAYTDVEMSEYSLYCQLVLEEKYAS